MADYVRRKNERDEKTSSATYKVLLIATEHIFIWENRFWDFEFQ